MGMWEGLVKGAEQELVRTGQARKEADAVIENTLRVSAGVSVGVSVESSLAVRKGMERRMQCCENGQP
jgi:hypothetical protein